MPDLLMDSEKLLGVEQRHRDAAAAFYGLHLARPGEAPVAAHMRAGKIDESPLIQAFARFERDLATPENGLKEALERMRKALMPFAELADWHDEHRGVFYPKELDERPGTLTPEMLRDARSALQHNTGERGGHSELAERVRGILSVIRTSVELDPDTDWDGSAVKILIEAVEALSQATR